MILLVQIHHLTLVFGRQILDFCNLPMCWKQYIDDGHHDILVGDIAEQCLESSVGEDVNITLNPRSFFIKILFHNFRF